MSIDLSDEITLFQLTKILPLIENGIGLKEVGDDYVNYIYDVCMWHQLLGKYGNYIVKNLDTSSPFKNDKSHIVVIIISPEDRAKEIEEKKDVG